MQIPELVMAFLKVHGSTILVCMSTFFLLNLIKSLMMPDPRKAKKQDGVRRTAV